MSKHSIQRSIWRWINKQDTRAGCLPEWVGFVVFVVIILAVVLSFVVR